MFRRLIILAGVALLACALAAPALGVRVKVRVEGKTTTIFGATQPTLMTGSNALAALDTASVAGEFYYHVRQTSFGPFVDQIGLYPGAGTSGWSFKINGVSPPVGADQMLQAFALRFANVKALTRVTATAHRRIELRTAREEHERRAAA